MRVYSVTGVPPEVQAYAMARYSRSAQSMRESIGELSSRRAEQFLDTFYFQYGHRSIADLAHLALAVEEISILAAIRLVDEPLWDGQERSTRYQDFRKSGYHTPATVAASPHAALYRDTADGMFAAYHRLSRRLLDVLTQNYPRPDEMDDGDYRRALRARAFDVARYILPLATHTSVGQVTSARVLERQIARLLADPLPEARAVGEALRAACREPAHDITRDQIRRALNGHSDDAALTEILESPPLAPTLVKYADAAPYASETYQEAAQAARAYLGDLTPNSAASVELASPASPEDEIAVSLLYRADVGGHSYRQIQAVVGDMTHAQRRELIDMSFRGRRRHDEWLREHQAGYSLTFDLLLDAGAFRDLHRHRRCIQIIQPFGAVHGADSPDEILRLGAGEAADDAIRSGLARDLGDAMKAGLTASRALAAEAGDEAAYLLPLGMRVRALFKMDLAQAAYIAELRTGVGGHFSYRRIAWLMYQAVAERHPDLAPYIRATDPSRAMDMLRR